MASIVTLTLNPALDIATSTGRVEPEHKLRCTAAQIHPGGGGVNVARVIARLGGDVLAVLTSGGVYGAQVQALLRAEQVRCECIAIEGSTRESFSVIESDSGREFRFVLPGPQLSEPEWQACLDRVAALTLAPRWLVASGSLPPGVPVDFYARLARLARARGMRLVLDTAGPPLAAALECGVEMIKPSLRELGELTGQPLDDAAQRRAACERIIERGQARVVALSLGAQGAMLVTAQGAWQAPALAVPVASTVGAGDSFVAAMVLALDRGESPESALRLGMAASAAALLHPGTALSQPQDVARLMPQVKVRAL